MAQILPPPPVQDSPGSFTWLEWYRNLRNYITQNGSVPWAIINFTGSSLSDLATRNHGVLQGVQGGGVGESYHLTQANHVKLTSLNTIEYTVPSSGGSATIANNTGAYIMKPAGVLATFTITMPASPVNQQQVTLSSTQTITALTHSPNTGQTLNGAATTLTANTPISWLYRTADTSWYRI